MIAPENARGRQRIRAIDLDNRDVFESGFPLVTLWQPTVPSAGDRLAEVTAKPLIVVGEQDDIAIKATADRLASEIPGAT